MLVSFASQRETYDAYLGLAEDLEALFGRKVDLIFSDWIHPRMRYAVYQPFHAEVDLTFLTGFIPGCVHTF